MSKKEIGARAALLCALLTLAYPARLWALSSPNSFCTGDPCVIASDKTADADVVLDFGNRAVVLGAVLNVDSLPTGNTGSLTILARTFSITANGQIKATGSTTASGGNVLIETTDDIALDGTRSTGAVRLVGSDAGNLTLHSSGGSVSGVGKLNLDGDGLYASGGGVTVVAAQNVHLTGDLIAGGGTQGGGGSLDVTAGGDVVLGLVKIDGGEFDGGDFCVVADGSVTLGEVDMDGGGDSGDAGIGDVSAGGSLTMPARFRGRGADNGENCGDGADVDLSAGADLRITGEVDIKGRAYDCSGGALTLDAARIYMQGSMDLRAQGSEGDGGSLDVYATELISFTGSIDLEGGDGGAGDLSFDSDLDVVSAGSIDAHGRSTLADGALFLEMDATTLSISGPINTDGAAGAAGGDVSFYACDITVAPLTVITARGNLGSIEVIGSDSIALHGQFIVDATGEIPIDYGTRADPPDLSGAVFSIPPTLTLDTQLTPCVLCESNAECDDGNACTDDVCTPSTGCTNAFNANPCDDGDQCTVGDVCSGGSCMGGAPRDCDDGNVCTDDACDPVLGCQGTANTASCDDGDACTQGDLCSGGSCAGTPLDCSDGNPCTDDVCSNGSCENPPNSAPCDDGDICTENDACSGGLCMPGPSMDCADTDGCTADSCDSVLGCVNQPIPGCSDADGDGKPDASDECTTLVWTSAPATPPNQYPAKFRLSVKKISRAAGSQGVLLKGLFNPAPSALPIDPATNGVYVRIADQDGVVYEVDVPGALTPCGSRDGWKTVGSTGRTTWKYKNKSGALPPSCTPGSAKGISTILVRDLRGSRKSAVQMKIKAKDATLDRNPVVPLTRVQADVVLAARPAPGAASAQAEAGQCAEALFTGNPIPSGGGKPFCKVKQKIGVLDLVACKGL